MTKTELLEELPRLTPADLVEVRAKVDELLGHVRLGKDVLSAGEKSELDSELAEYEKDPEPGGSVEQLTIRIPDRADE